MDSLSPETRDLLTLHLIPGLGPRLTQALLERFGSVERILQASTSELQEVPHIGPKLAPQISAAMMRLDLAKELRLIEEHQVTLLRLGTPEYPPALATIAVPPLLLYVRGAVTEADSQAVALVGSRQCSSYGRRIAEKLGGDLARAGFTVVSGLARGIDGAAHRGALNAGGRTIAVMACGLGRVYPPEHRDLADEVCKSGALVSEANMEMEPLATMFPARNRIISGLTRAVVIVEAAEQSGALITAQHALEQGREVFAVPGPVDSPYSTGALQLLLQGAKLIRHAQDIIEDLDGIAPLVDSRATAKAPPPNLEGHHKTVWDALENEAHYFDDLARKLQIPSPELTRTLTELELQKLIRRLPGNRYERF